MLSTHCFLFRTSHNLLRKQHSSKLLYNEQQQQQQRDATSKTLSFNDTQSSAANSTMTSHASSMSSGGAAAAAALCRCKTSCSTKRCACFKMDGRCSDYCRCSPQCTNRELQLPESTTNDDDDDTAAADVSATFTILLADLYGILLSWLLLGSIGFWFHKTVPACSVLLCTSQCSSSPIVTYI